MESVFCKKLSDKAEKKVIGQPNIIIWIVW